MNIPIYRGKMKDNGEFVEGHLYKQLSSYYIMEIDEKILKQEVEICGNSWGFNEIALRKEIDQQTLAIHFQGMIDKNGERIFAALNDSGVGGSYEEDIENIWIWFYKNGKIYTSNFDDEYDYEFVKNEGEIEVTGIYEG